MGMRQPATTVAARFRALLLLVLLAVAWTSSPRAERMGYPPEEFASRRQRLRVASGTSSNVTTKRRALHDLPRRHQAPRPLS